MSKLALLYGGPLDGETMVLFDSSNIINLRTLSGRVVAYELNGNKYEYIGYRSKENKISKSVPYNTYKGCLGGFEDENRSLSCS